MQIPAARLALRSMSGAEEPWRKAVKAERSDLRSKKKLERFYSGAAVSKVKAPALGGNFLASQA